MYQSARPNGSVGNSRRFRLETGLELLDSWATTAGQADKNAVYRVLFTVVEALQVLNTEVFDDRGPNEFSVLARKDLVLGIRLHGPDSFGISYVGPVERAEADPVVD